MSAKSTKQPKKLSVPRPLNDIQNEYGQVAVQAGTLQYQIAVYTEDLKSVNERLRKLNLEANARNQLDKETSVKTEIQETINASK